MRHTLFILFTSIIALAAHAQHSQPPLQIGSRLQLFLDTHAIERATACEPRMHAPISRQVVFSFDAPWEGAESGYITILRDGDKYRMYYRGGGETTQEVSCMAESGDGISWTRPRIGQFEFRGSRDNNIVLDVTAKRKSYGECHNFTPFLDANPEAKPAERYKAVAMGRQPERDNRPTLMALASPDGIKWTHMRHDPVITSGSFDSQNVAFWDTNREAYACYSRVGRQGKRSIQLTTSPDFLRWSDPVPLDFGNTPLEHFYTNAIQQYPPEPSIYIGLPMRFVPERKYTGLEHRKTDGLSDAVLISSHDGLHFDRTFMEASIRPGLDPQNWGNAHGNQTPVWGIIETTATELSVYWSDHYGGTPRVRRGTLRKDGFASMHAGYAGGEFVTKPFTFEGTALELNVSTSAVGSVRVELQNADSEPVTGFSANDCEEIWGDEIARRVRWRGTTDVSSHGDGLMRLRFLLKDADLYAFRFTP